MGSVNLRKPTKMVKHSWVKHANSGPERDSNYEKMGTVAAVGEGSCDGSIILG